MNKVTFATVVQQLCGRESVQHVRLSMWHICEKLFLDCVMYLNVLYVMKLKLASGNAYYCNDRSGIKQKEEMYFF